MKEISTHPMGLIRKEMFEKGSFACVESDLDINDYPPVEIETRHHSTIRDNTTITTLVK